MPHEFEISSNIGRYDRLYSAVGTLWSEAPGRMVRQASKISRVGRALDVGCGDGKNALYLAKLGWEVDAFDVSALALACFQKRLKGTKNLSIRAWQDNAHDCDLRQRSYQLVVAYGLYHCLSDADVVAAHSRVTRAVAPGGLLAYAAFNDRLPVPPNHGTEKLYLRDEDHILGLALGWTVEAYQIGTISEAHFPVIGEHQHSLTWALLRKPF